MMLLLIFVLIVFGNVKCDIKLSTNEITIAVGEIATFQAEADFINSVREKDVCTMLKLVSLNIDVVQVIPNSIRVDNNNDVVRNFTCDINLQALKAGMSGISITKTSSRSDTLRGENEFLVVKVYKSLIIKWVSSVIGWTYFFAWSISFYPQMYTNYKRRSVAGLNFDFLLFNIIGYFMYNTFNAGVFFLPKIKEQYSFRHPRSLNPVQPNDIFFSSHGLLATSVTIFQCFMYERANQKISITAKVIVGLYFLATTGYVIFASLGIVLWLDVLYMCSYIKLCVTVTKYMPQIYMNYKRKSTRGWSIGAVLLDFTGGILSILQMGLDGNNYDNWIIIVENPTKFGLGILTIGFDLIFAIQHYVLYTISSSEMDIKMTTL